MWVLKTYKPKKILELGTAVAYSTIIMAGNDKDADIVTIENY